MTRPEIEAKLKAENPFCTIGKFTFTEGDPEYEAKIQEWADNYEVSLAQKAAQEAEEAETAADKTELGNVKKLYQAFVDGTATNRQAQRAIAIIIKRLAKLEEVE